MLLLLLLGAVLELFRVILSERSIFNS